MLGSAGGGSTGSLYGCGSLIGGSVGSAGFGVGGVIGSFDMLINGRARVGFLTRHAERRSGRDRGVSRGAAAHEVEAGEDDRGT